MKPKTYRLYYDSNCPLCVAYTALFVKWRILPANGRLTFSEIASEKTQRLDMNRARNEIALVEVGERQVFYGVDSLIELLNSRFPFVKPVARFFPLYFLLKQLYAFISYNRKVIAGDAICSGKTCTPDFNAFYRWVFIVMAIVACSFITTTYLMVFTKGEHQALFTKILFGWISFSLIVQIVLKYRTSGKYQCLHLLGNLWAVLLLGNLMLLLPILLNALGCATNAMFLMVYLLLTMLYAIRLYCKRCHVINILNKKGYPL